MWVSTLPRPGMDEEASWPRRASWGGGAWEHKTARPLPPRRQGQCPARLTSLTAMPRPLLPALLPGWLRLARDEKDLQGEAGPWGRGSLGTWPKCTQGDFRLGPWAKGAHPSGNVSYGGPNALFSWKTCCLRGPCGQGGSSTWGKGLLKDIHILTACTPP